MTISPTYRTLKQIAQHEFADIVVNATILTLSTGAPLKLRLDIADGSIADVFVSGSGRYSYHWDRRIIGIDEIYRHDNAPHHRWRNISTFPRHFHSGQERNVVESYLDDDFQQAIRQFLTFIREKLLAPESL
jgi:hypothetical protein